MKVKLVVEVDNISALRDFMEAGRAYSLHDVRVRNFKILMPEEEDDRQTPVRPSV